MIKVLYSRWFFVFFVTFFIYNISKAEIVYTDLIPDEVIFPPSGGSQSYTFDFNSDNNIDFYVQVNNNGNYSNIIIYGVLQYNQIAGDGNVENSEEFYPISFQSNEEIGESSSYSWNNFWDENWGHELPTKICGFGLTNPGHWAGGSTNRFVGVRFVCNQVYYYGWIAIDIPAASNSCTIKGFAYESEAETFIKAGDHTTGINDNTASSSADFNIYPNPTTDKIIVSYGNNKFSGGTVSICNSLGIEVKRIDNSDAAGRNLFAISTDELPQGMYNCTITNNKNRITKCFIVVK